MVAVVHAPQHGEQQVRAPDGGKDAADRHLADEHAGDDAQQRAERHEDAHPAHAHGLKGRGKRRRGHNLGGGKPGRGGGKGGVLTGGSEEFRPPAGWGVGKAGGGAQPRAGTHCAHGGRRAHLGVGHHEHQAERHEHVDDGHKGDAGDDADGHVARGLLHLLGHRGHAVKADEAAAAAAAGAGAVSPGFLVGEKVIWGGGLLTTCVLAYAYWQYHICKHLDRTRRPGRVARVTR